VPSIFNAFGKGAKKDS
jgi:hypothetical protein